MLKALLLVCVLLLASRTVEATKWPNLFKRNSKHGGGEYSKLVDNDEDAKLVENEGQVMDSSPWETYSKLLLLGYGNSGVTYKVKSKLSGQIYALKEFRDCTPNQQATAQHEFEVVRNLNHNNIARTHAFYKWDNKNCAIVMEWIKGTTLGDCIDNFLKCMDSFRKDLMANNHALLWNLVSQVASGLRYLCSQEIVHADLSQNNLIFDIPKKRAVIIDFGEAIKFPIEGPLKSRLESCAAQSPERLLTNKISGPPACHEDVFALCAITSALFGKPITTPRYGCAAQNVYQNYAKIYKGDNLDWSNLENTPLLPSDKILQNIKQHFALKKISDAEAKLIMDMCHWDFHQRLSSATLVDSIRNL